MSQRYTIDKYSTNAVLIYKGWKILTCMLVLLWLTE